MKTIKETEERPFRFRLSFTKAALAYIGTGAAVVRDVNWLDALSAVGFGFVTAVLLALTGLPEAEEK